MVNTPTDRSNGSSSASPSLAFTNASATPTRLAMLAPSSSRWAPGRLLSSRVAEAAVSWGVIGAMAHHARSNTVSAATSQPMSTVSCHGANQAATAAAAPPASVATTNRRAADFLRPTRASEITARLSHGRRARS